MPVDLFTRMRRFAVLGLGALVFLAVRSARADIVQIVAACQWNTSIISGSCPPP